MNVNIDLHDKLLEHIDRLARELGQTRSALIRQAVEAWVARRPNCGVGGHGHGTGIRARAQCSAGPAGASGRRGAAPPACDPALRRERGARNRRLRGELSRTGNPIGPFDALIAGTALTHRLIVVTSNSSEFRRVPGLSVEDWREFQVHEAGD